MGSEVTFVAAIAFLIIVVLLTMLIYRGIIGGMRQARYSSKAVNTTAYTALIGIIVWLIVTGGLASLGFFMNFSSMPPAITWAILPPIVAVIYVYRSSKLTSIINKMPKPWLVNIHFFRVFIDLVFWFLYNERQAPQELTIEGYNIDIVIGVLSPFIAYRCFRSKAWPVRYAKIWNIMGMLTLLYISAVCVLGAETSFRVIQGYSTKFIGDFPFIWLLGFIIPFYFLLHMLSLRQMNTKTAGDSFIIKRKKKEGRLFEN